MYYNITNLFTHYQILFIVILLGPILKVPNLPFYLTYFLKPIHMKKSYLLTIPFFIISTVGFSQNLSRNTMTAQGDFSQNESVTLEWTIGETFTETVVTPNKMFTQGFQQPFLTASRLETETLEKTTSEIVLYPNPVESLLYVYLKSSPSTKLYINIYDVTGKLIKQATILETDTNSTLNVSELSSGVYLMKFSNADGSLIETHQILKY